MVLTSTLYEPGTELTWRRPLTSTSVRSVPKPRRSSRLSPAVPIARVEFAWLKVARSDGGLFKASSSDTSVARIGQIGGRDRGDRHRQIDLRACDAAARNENVAVGLRCLRCWISVRICDTRRWIGLCRCRVLYAEGIILVQDVCAVRLNLRIGIRCQTCLGILACHCALSRLCQ